MTDDALRSRLVRVTRETLGDKYGFVMSAEAAEAVVAALLDEMRLHEERRVYEKFETTAVMGGTGAMAYGGQSTRSLGWREDIRWTSPWVSVSPNPEPEK